MYTARSSIALVLFTLGSLLSRVCIQQVDGMSWYWSVWITYLLFDQVMKRPLHQRSPLFSIDPPRATGWWAHCSGTGVSKNHSACFESSL